MIDLHVHSKYSDGCCDVREVARVAKSAGLKMIAIVDHSVEHPRGLDERKAARRLEEIDDAASAYGIRIYSGVECGIDAAGKIHLPDFSFDLVIASVHDFVDGIEYYRRVIGCVESCDFDVLGHPFSQRFGFETRMAELDERLVELMAEHGIAVEINSSHETPPGDFLVLCDEFRIPYTVGSDAHSLQRIGAVEWSFERAKRYMKRSELFIP
ncbi:MAG: PHP domain-containing protein [Archaeoglobaceae archaeon]